MRTIKPEEGLPEEGQVGIQPACVEAEMSGEQVQNVAARRRQRIFSFEMELTLRRFSVVLNV